MNILQLIWQLIQSLLFRRAMRAEIADDVCVACDSDDLTMLAERVYRCNLCGYEGGSGYADMQGQQRRLALDQLTGSQRQKRILSNLQEVRTLASSAHGTLKAAGQANLRDVFDAGTGNYIGSGQESSEALEELMSGMQLLMEAQTLVEEVSHLNGEPMPSHLEIDVELGFASSVLDTHADSMFAEFFTRSKINKASSCAQRMEQWAQHQLAAGASSASGAW